MENINIHIHARDNPSKLPNTPGKSSALKKPMGPLGKQSIAPHETLTTRNAFLTRSHSNLLIPESHTLTASQPRIWTPFMATWLALPPEIQDRILYFFSLSVVHEYEKHDPADFWDRTARPSPQLGKCPAIPHSLVSVTSALKTCRFFHNSLTNVVKLDGQSLIEVLQNIQYRRILDLIKYYFESDAKPEIHIGWFVESAGYFWKNPKLIDDKDAIADVLYLISRKSRMMLLPHVEQWLIRHAITADHNHPRIKLDDANRPKCGNPCIDQTAVIYNDYVSNSISLLGDIITTPSMYDEDADEDDKDDDWKFIYAYYSAIPLVWDLRNSQPSTWWLYHNDCSGHSPGWFLVNYGDKKLYVGPDGTQAYYWENFGHQTLWKKDWHFSDFGHENPEARYNDMADGLFCNWNHGMYSIMISKDNAIEHLEPTLLPNENNKYQSSGSAPESSPVLKIKDCSHQRVHQKWRGRNISFEWMY